MLNRFVNYTSLILLGILICSCGGTTNVKNSADKSGTQKNGTQSIFAALDNTLDPLDLLDQARKKTGTERDALQLQAAQIYLAQNKLDKARNLVNQIDKTRLNDEAFVNYSQVIALIALNDNDLDGARRILTNPRVERNLNALDPQQEASLRETRAQVFERSGHLKESIDERISLSAILTNTESSNDNQAALWKTLMELPLARLQANALKGAGGITQGWYSLAALSKNNTQNLATQQAQLSKWLTQWRSHPANGNLPKDLEILNTLIRQQPQKIALLLPFKGRLAEAGAAVRDGFFAAYYQSLYQSQNQSQNQNSGQANANQNPSVRQYDTSMGAVAAYQLAVADGANFIIGPLEKEDVNQISLLPNLPVPLLSLNYPDKQPVSLVNGFYQFGLAVEDEARQIAREAFQNGFSRALVVVPTQEWSERSANAFVDEWQKLGGAIVGKTQFIKQNQLSDALRNIMLIDESQQRMLLLQQQLGGKFEFNPRRRDDIDLVFMPVTPAQGRQIRPTFAFHYANNIPTFATSNIYSGDKDAVNNEDLNGVMFNTLPWLFDNNNPEKQAIAQTTKSSAVYSRLHALGADSFHLYARIPQLKLAPEMKLYGTTGSLRLVADGRIERDQIWARFTGGLVEPIATIPSINKEPQGE
jgi:uncharacterized protein